MSEFIVTISKGAEAMIKAGTAKVSSGGIRNRENGKMIEMFVPQGRPGLMKDFSLTSVASPTTLASSVVGNVQNYYIQKGINEVNQKIDKLSDVLSVMDKLTWVNTAVSLLNCGMSIAFFYKTNKELNGIDNKLDVLSREITKIHEKIDTDKSYQAQKNVKNLVHYMSSLRSGNISVRDKETDMVKQINELEADINYFRDQILRNNLEIAYALDRLLYLYIVFEKVVKEFSIFRRYEFGELPDLYNSWVETVKELNSKEFQQVIQNGIYLRFPMFTERKIFNILKFTKEDLLYGTYIDLKNSIDFSSHISRKEYVDIDTYVIEKVRSGDYQTQEIMLLSEL